ncbi:MAG TPA: hypothetical protein VNW97_12420 [Candidatus Saccharimonadales bacterium]|jgi:hypothetical protein|nr:hypothetical protein [Candidatus Saccharimonadales bacterium]
MSFIHSVVLLALAPVMAVMTQPRIVQQSMVQPEMLQQKQRAKKGPGTAAKPAGLSAAAEDISGAYSFLHEGESLQLILDAASVSGYVVRKGDLDSDRGVVLSQFFRQAAVEGHEVSFTTKTIHGVWFEFKGRFERGAGKAKTADGYYLLKGELKEFTTDQEGKSTARTRGVEFKWMGQPE